MREVVSMDNQYLRRLGTAFLYAKEFNALQGKSEIGAEVSYYATADLASTLAEIIARELRLSDELSRVLAYVRGSVFPPYGKAGLHFLKDYASQHHIEFQERNVAISILSSVLSRNHLKPTEELLTQTNRLFTQETGFDEASVVKLVYHILDVKYILSLYGIAFDTFDIVFEAACASRDAGAIIADPTFQRIVAEKRVVLDNHRFVLADWQQEDLRSRLTEKSSRLNAKEALIEIMTEKETLPPE